jgi:hypothetical protein
MVIPYDRMMLEYGHPKENGQSVDRLGFEPKVERMKKMNTCGW